MMETVSYEPYEAGIVNYDNLNYIARKDFNKLRKNLITFSERVEMFKKYGKLDDLVKKIGGNLYAKQDLFYLSKIVESAKKPVSLDDVANKIEEYQKNSNEFKKLMIGFFGVNTIGTGLSIVESKIKDSNSTFVEYFKYFEIAFGCVSVLSGISKGIKLHGEKSEIKDYKSMYSLLDISSVILCRANNEGWDDTKLKECIRIAMKVYSEDEPYLKDISNVIKDDKNTNLSKAIEEICLKERGNLII